MKKSFYLISFLFLSIPAAWSQSEMASAHDTFMASLDENNAANSEVSFPGGADALRIYLADHFRYSQKAVENGLEGKVIVKFTVRKDGKACNPVIKQSLHPILDQAAINVINSMPNWQPRMMNGVAVTSSVEIPFEVRIR